LFEVIPQYRHLTGTICRENLSPYLPRITSIGKSENLFSELHVQNLVSLAKKDIQLEDVVRQPLWNQYFQLCSAWNVDLIQDNPKTPPNQRWERVQILVLPASKIILTTRVNLLHHNLSIDKLHFVAKHQSTYLSLVQTLLGGDAATITKKEIDASTNEEIDYGKKVQVVSSFVDSWAHPSPKWDVSTLASFVSKAATRYLLTINDINAEVFHLTNNLPV
jgi:hypothetical protein